MSPQHGKDSLLLSIVTPVFNEESSIAPFLRSVGTVLGTHGIAWEMIFINDGSTDSTLNSILSASKGNLTITVVDLTRNFGKEAALSAGLRFARGELIVPMDVDLQDPPEVIPKMIAKIDEGYDVVIAKRATRQSDSIWKKIPAEAFHLLLSSITKPPIPRNVGDFRMLTRRVLTVINELPENQRYMKGLFSWVGFNTYVINYDRAPRRSGETKFRLSDLISLSIDGITSFSVAPLRLAFLLGSIISATSLLFAVYLIMKVSLYGVDVPGYASLMVVISALSGIQIMLVGIVGEYVGKIYMEAKGRPNFLIKDIYRNTEKQSH